jgi:CHASE3 domain sensor protein
MKQFDYTYLTFREVMNNINYIYNFSFLEHIFIIFLLIIIFLLGYYIIPYFQIQKENLIIKSNQDKKRDFIKKLLLQREIEEEIEREIEEESLLKDIKK